MSSAKSGQMALAALAAIPFAWLAYRRYARSTAAAAAAGAAGAGAAAAAPASAAPSSVAVKVANYEKLANGTGSGSANSSGNGSGDAKKAAEEAFDCYYFGYGSNMSTRTMNRRNIHPASSCPAVLRGYRLAMNLASSLAPLEPTFANVEPAPGRDVHGVLHRVTRANIDQLTREEGGGESYVRMELPVTTYDGVTVTAYCFVLPDHRAHMKTKGGDVPCSARYLGLLVHGAKDMKLAPDYIAFLEALPTAPLPRLADVLTDARKQQIAARAVTMDDVKDTTKGYVWTALKGVVLDLSADRTFLRRVFGSQDKTVDMAKFLCDAECPLPTSVDQFNARHKAFVDAALATIMSLHPIVGHVKDQTFDW